MPSTATVELPALPERGAHTAFRVMSRTSDATYSFEVTVHLDGAVYFACGCPSVRKCWHKTVASDIYSARGEVRDRFGILADTRPPAAPDPGDIDPFDIPVQGWL